jgi:hypothetical protein
VALVLNSNQKGTIIMKIGMNLKIAAFTALFLAGGTAFAADSGSIDQLSGTVTVTGADKVVAQGRTKRKDPDW